MKKMQMSPLKLRAISLLRKPLPSISSIGEKVNVPQVSEPESFFTEVKINLLGEIIPGETLIHLKGTTGVIKELIYEDGVPYVFLLVKEQRVKISFCCLVQIWRKQVLSNN